MTRVRSEDDSAGDFSGIRSTLDPTLAPTGSKPRANPEPEKEATAPLPLMTPQEITEPCATASTNTCRVAASSISFNFCDR